MTTRTPRRRGRDAGSVLPLVLVLIVVAGLIVVPTLNYAVTVFRSNHVVSDRTRAVEAAKGGVRIALGDPRDVFLTCDEGGDLTPPDPVVNGIALAISCSEIAEIGPLDALGFEVPTGAAAVQLGAEVPVELSGTRAQSDPVPPYPEAGPGWWVDPAWTAREFAALVADRIWLPDLPRLPGTERTETPFEMPPAFGCTAYFPGRYTAPLELTGDVYFASGVYYFEQPVTVSGDADVVVGYGLEELPNPECSDDIQVAANVIGDPGTFDINGGGATWVFGRDGRLIVDDSETTTALRLRFNQRYADADRGGRVSIMTVNGDDVAPGDHLVTDVSFVPRSQVLSGETSLPLDGSGYSPSSSTYTDRARPPLSPAAFAATPLRYGEPGDEHGALLLEWDRVEGQAAGGAILDGYEVTITPAPPEPDVCGPADLVVSAPATPPDPERVACLVTGLDLDQDYSATLVAVNEAGASPVAGASGRPDAGSDVLTVPDPPQAVEAIGGVDDDVAQVRWTAPSNGGAPITGYEVTAHRVYLAPRPNLGPAGEDVTLTVAPGVTGAVRVPVSDPNGDALALVVDDSGLDPAEWTIDVTGLDVSVTATAPDGAYTVPYTVTDPDGEAATATLQVVVTSSPPAETSPAAADVTLTPDIGVPTVTGLAVHDPDGDALTVTADLGGLDPADWVVFVSGTQVSVTTTAPDGAYSIPYVTTDPDGNTASGTIEVTVARASEQVGACTVEATTDAPLPTACEIAGLPDLAPGDATSGNVGYRFDVTARNTLGSSAPASNDTPWPLAFDGGGVPLDPAPARVVEPWQPEPVIQVVAANGKADVEVAIAGYVSIPMGRIAIDNPDGDDVRVNGGIVSGTFSVADARAVEGQTGSLPIGFKNDIVLQRKLAIVSRARNITATAIVQVNEDGAGYAVNSWVVQ